MNGSPLLKRTGDKAAACHNVLGVRPLDAAARKKLAYSWTGPPGIVQACAIWLGSTGAPAPAPAGNLPGAGSPVAFGVGAFVESGEGVLIESFIESFIESLIESLIESFIESFRASDNKVSIENPFFGICEILEKFSLSIRFCCETSRVTVAKIFFFLFFATAIGANKRPREF